MGNGIHKNSEKKKLLIFLQQIKTISTSNYEMHWIKSSEKIEINYQKLEVRYMNY